VDHDMDAPVKLGRWRTAKVSDEQVIGIMSWR
jgi:hypothetical protein